MVRAAGVRVHFENQSRVLAPVAKNFDNRVQALGFLLQGKTLSLGTEELERELFVLVDRVIYKWGL